MIFVLKVKLGSESMREGGHVAALLRRLANLLEVYGEDFSVRPRSSGAILDLQGHEVAQWATKEK